MLAAVLGSPIAHSLSPVLHNAAYRELGLPHEYSAVEVTVADFPRFIATLNSFWLGVSLTMPLKEAAFSVAGTVTHDSDLDSKGNLWYTDESAQLFGRFNTKTHEIKEWRPPFLPEIPKGQMEGTRDIIVDTKDRVWFPLRRPGNHSYMARFDPATEKLDIGEQASQFVAAGGDGTVNEVLNGITDVPGGLQQALVVERRMEMAGARGQHAAEEDVAQHDRADDEEPRLGDALLRTDHVDDALGPRVGVEEADAEVLRVLAEGLDHLLGDRVGIGLLQLVRRNDVVDRREGPLGILHLKAQVAEHAEGLGTGHLMDEVGADEELGLPVGQLAHRVRFPNFLEQGLGHLGKR